VQDAEGSYKGEYAKVADLVPYARNARKHPPEQVEAIAKGMLRWGYTNPTLVDLKGIIAGHGRCLAAALLYERGETLKHPDGRPIPKGCVPVIDVSGWSPAKRRAYIIADNELADRSEWDEAMLKDELGYLRDTDADLAALSGFGENDMVQILSEHWESDHPAPARPEVQADPRAPIKIVCEQADADRVREAVVKVIARLKVPGLEVQ
jgi:hypothetical protein